MNYFVDTNIILCLFRSYEKPFRKDIEDILKSPDNKLFASAISLNEIVQLSRKKKIEGIDKEKYNTPKKTLDYILRKTKGIVEFLPYAPKIAKFVAELEYVAKHNDPNDLHAMSEKMPIISTDKKFPHYEKQGVEIISNPL